MTLQFVLQLECAANLSIQLNGGILGDGEDLPVGGEGVVGHGMVEEVVDFGRCHDDEGGAFDEAIGVALYYHQQVAVGVVKGRKGAVKRAGK